MLWSIYKNKLFLVSTYNGYNSCSLRFFGHDMARSSVYFCSASRNRSQRSYKLFAFYMPCCCECRCLGCEFGCEAFEGEVCTCLTVEFEYFSSNAFVYQLCNTKYHHSLNSLKQVLYKQIP